MIPQSELIIEFGTEGEEKGMKASLRKPNSKESRVQFSTSSSV